MTIIISCCNLVNASQLPIKDNTSHAKKDPHIIKVGLPSHPFHDSEVSEEFTKMINLLKEYWQIWAIDSRLTIEFIRLPPHDLINAMKEGKADVAAISMYDAKLKDVLFSLPYAKYKQYLFKRLTTGNQKEFSIGVHQFHNNPLTFIPPYFQTSYFHNLDELVENSDRYNSLYSHQPALLGDKLAEKNLLKNFYVSNKEVPPIYLRFATRKSQRKLMHLINDGIRGVSTAQAEVWKNKYPFAHDNLTEITLGQYINNISDAEKDYVIDHIEINYPITQNGIPPFIITNDSSSVTERGLTIDLLKIAQEKMGPIFTPTYVNNTKDAQLSIINKQTDLLLHEKYEKESIEHLQFTTPYLTSQYSVVYRHQYELGEYFENLKNEKIAVVKQSEIIPFIKNRYPQATLVEFNTTEEAIFSVSSTQSNVYIGYSLNSGYLIKKNRLSNLVSRPLENVQNEAQFSFATLKENEILVTLLNRTLTSIPAEQLDNIYTKWSKTSFPESDVNSQIQNIYRKASYVLALIFLFGVLVFSIYYRQIQKREVSRKKIENELVKAEEARLEAEKSAQEKTTFLARMSHEIRTPMNGVFGMAEALSFTNLNTHQQELLGTLTSSASNLMALLNDVLDFSKMDAGKLTLESVPVNLHQLTRNIIIGFNSLVSNELILNSEVDDKITHNYLADPTRLTQILNNLLSNAIKFTEKGKISLSLSLTNSISDNDVQTDFIKISVKDTGIGIPKEHQTGLFTPFTQADDQITRKFGGTGLGLSICHEIISAMGSAIHLKSSLGHGSEFYFTLALKQSGIESDTDDRRKNRRVINPPNDERFKNIKVLVAEDNLVNLKVLSAQLERLNIFADIAEDGEQALKMHKDNTYDIIISDCHMPKVDGFELASTISKQDKTKPIWLIAITADAMSGAAENCIAAGFNDYISKPCPQEVITDKLNNAYRQLYQSSIKIE